MNYKVVLSWIISGLLAYIAGRSANAGLQAFSGTLAFVLLIVGISELNSFKDSDDEKKEKDIKHHSDKVAVEKKSFKPLDVVKIIDDNGGIDSYYLGKTGRIIRKGKIFDWILEVGGTEVPVREFQLELASLPTVASRGTTKKPKRARKFRVTVEGMSQKDRQKIYSARYAAKKKNLTKQQ